MKSPVVTPGSSPSASPRKKIKIGHVAGKKSAPSSPLKIALTAPIPIISTDDDEILFSPPTKSSPYKKFTVLRSGNDGTHVRTRLKFAEDGELKPILEESFHYPQVSPHPYIPQMKLNTYLLSPLEAARRLDEYNKNKKKLGNKRKRDKVSNDYSSILIPKENNINGYFLTYYREYYIGQTSLPTIFHSFYKKTNINTGVRSAATLGAGAYGTARVVELREAVRESEVWHFTENKPQWAIIKVFKGTGIQNYLRAKAETELTSYLGDYSDLPIQPMCWYDSSTGKTFMLDSYIPGPDLGVHIKKGTKFSPEVMYQTAEQLCLQGMSIWRKGFLHRDIKPDNIQLYIDANGKAQAKLRDFGMAISQAQAAQAISIGTPTYMPNILNFAGQHQNIPADLYGIGATIKHMAGWQGETYPMYSPFFKKTYPKYTFPPTFPAGADQRLLVLFHFSNWCMQFKTHSQMLLESDGKEKLLQELACYLEILKISLSQTLDDAFLAELEHSSFAEPNEIPDFSMEINPTDLCAPVPAVPLLPVRSTVAKTEVAAETLESNAGVGEIFKTELREYPQAAMDKENFANTKGQIKVLKNSSSNSPVPAANSLRLNY